MMSSTFPGATNSTQETQAHSAREPHGIPWQLHHNCGKIIQRCSRVPGEQTLGQHLPPNTAQELDA